VYSTFIFTETHKPHRIRQAKRDSGEEDHESRVRTAFRKRYVFFARSAFGVRCCCAALHGAATQQTPRDDCVARGRYFLFTTTHRAGFRNSNWALTFSICAAWSFTVAARRATVASNSAILFCCF
jgi:hypothetical protein